MAMTGKSNRNPTTMRETRSVRRHVRGKTRITSTHKLTMRPTSVAAVRCAMSERWLTLASEKAVKMEAAMTSPAGMANRKTRSTNPDRYRRSFGPRARKNAGMPMASVSMMVRCRGNRG